MTGEAGGHDGGGDSVEDVPPDVRATLETLLSAVLETDDPETAREALSTAETVVETKLPDPEERERLAHGCRRARAADDPALAAEYVRAVRERL